MTALHEKLISTPVLALPYTGGHNTLDTDACNVQVGCVQLQEQPDSTKILAAYWSPSLAKVERAYNTTQKECLAILSPVLLLRLYLEGTRITIRYGHITALLDAY